MDIESHIQKANKAIRHAQAIQQTSKKLLLNDNDDPDSLNLTTLSELSRIMDKVVSSTEKSMNGAKLAESRARSRLMAVKKAAAKTIHHTAKAKRAAITSKKALHAALLTSKKLNGNPKLRKIYNTQVKAALKAAKLSEQETCHALKASKTARLAARMPLEPMKI